jgi:hypothetical protein
LSVLMAASLGAVAALLHAATARLQYPEPVLGLVELLGDMLLDVLLDMPFSVLGLDMLSDGFLLLPDGAMLPLGMVLDAPLPMLLPILLLMLFCAKAAGPSRAMAQAAAAKKRNIGVSCLGGAGRSRSTYMVWHGQLRPMPFGHGFDALPPGRFWAQNKGHFGAAPCAAEKKDGSSTR